MKKPLQLPAETPKVYREVLTIGEVADCLRISRRSAYRLAKTGQLPGRKVAGQWRFLLQDVLHWIRNSAPLAPHHSSHKENP